MARRPSDRKRLERLLAQYDREIAAAFLAAAHMAQGRPDRAYLVLIAPDWWLFPYEVALWNREA